LILDGFLAQWAPRMLRLSDLDPYRSLRIMVSLSRLARLTALASVLAAPAFAEDLVFTLSNNTSADLQEFYTSPADVNNWEEDVLGTDMLGAGSSAQVTIADGRTQCNYDMRFVFTDGSELEDTADLCETGSYTLTE
jgi:hypothetical protein